MISFIIVYAKVLNTRLSALFCFYNCPRLQSGCLVPTPHKDAQNSGDKKDEIDLSFRLLHSFYIAKSKSK